MCISMVSECLHVDLMRIRGMAREYQLDQMRVPCDMHAFLTQLAFVSEMFPLLIFFPFFDRLWLVC